MNSLDSIGSQLWNSLQIGKNVIEITSDDARLLLIAMWRLNVLECINKEMQARELLAQQPV